MMFDPHAYTVFVKKVLVDNEQMFRAAVKELPHVDAYGDSYQEAYEACVDAIESLHEMAQERGERFPSPIQEEEDFSGRVTLRMPKTIHREIATLAEMEGVSLNHYVVAVLARQVGSVTSQASEVERSAEATVAAAAAATSQEPVIIDIMAALERTFTAEAQSISYKLSNELQRAEESLPEPRWRTTKHLKLVEGHK